MSYDLRFKPDGDVPAWSYPGAATRLCEPQASIHVGVMERAGWRLVSRVEVTP